MKVRLFTLALPLILSGLMASAQTVYYPAEEFPLYGKVSEDTEGRYERLPVELKTISRDPVLYLGRCSAGLYLRFRSNSTSIFAHWTTEYGTDMNHFTWTGVRGLDLYVLNEGKWRFAGSGRPEKGRESRVAIVENMEPKEREYMLYLSLYDVVTSLEIGIDSLATIGQPHVQSPSTEKPIVMYGTSILQGGCASRPGMAHTNILSRKLGREVINLGFSGNALLDMEIARLMASVKDPGLFVLDYVPNASFEMIDEHGEEFFRIIRDAHPQVPVIFIEDPQFTHALFDQRMAKEICDKNHSQKALFEKLRKAGEKRIYYIPSECLIGDDGEACVDGVHFTDLGMMRYTDAVLPVIRKALKK